MHFLAPSWQLSATLSCLLTVLTFAARKVTSRTSVFRFVPGATSFCREFAVVAGLLGLWQFVGGYVRSHSAGAMHRADQVQSLQRWLHLPNQLAMQHAVLPHPDLIRALNVYYAYAHLNSMTFFLFWVWWRRRDSFRTVRNTVVASTLVCLVVQTIPVAPPRLLVGGGYLDTALAYGQSVYGQYSTGLASQLTAMPSVHVGWAFIVAWYVARLGRGPLRWLGVLHLVTTVLVVVLTANHWWLDGAVAIAITLLVMAGQAVLRDVLQTRQEESRTKPGRPQQSALQEHNAPQEQGPGGQQDGAPRADREPTGGFEPDSGQQVVHS